MHLLLWPTIPILFWLYLCNSCDTSIPDEVLGAVPAVVLERCGGDLKTIGSIWNGASQHIPRREVDGPIV